MTVLRTVHPGTRENLSRFLHFIEDACSRIDASADVKYALRIAVEEVCTNLIDYGYRDRSAGPIDVTVYDEQDRVTIVISDRAPPFDPASAPPPDLTSDVEHRRIGGFGWYLVKQMIDDMSYVAGAPSGNVLTLVKHKSKNSGT